MNDKNDFDKIAELISAQLGEKIANNDSTPIFYGVAAKEESNADDINSEEANQ